MRVMPRWEASSASCDMDSEFSLRIWSCECSGTRWSGCTFTNFTPASAKTSKRSSAMRWTSFNTDLPGKFIAPTYTPPILACLFALESTLVSSERMETYQAIMTRRSVHRPDPGRVPSRDIVEKLLAAAVRAPSHHLTQPWRFIVLTGDALRDF